jgi:hypothetical protein
MKTKKKKQKKKKKEIGLESHNPRSTPYCMGINLLDPADHL